MFWEIVLAVVVGGLILIWIVIVIYNTWRESADASEFSQVIAGFSFIGFLIFLVVRNWSQLMQWLGIG